MIFTEEKLLIFPGFVHCEFSSVAIGSQYFFPELSFSWQDLPGYEFPEHGWKG